MRKLLYVHAVVSVIHRARRAIPMLAVLLAIGLVAGGADAAGESPAKPAVAVAAGDGLAPSATGDGPSASSSADGPADTQVTYTLAATLADVPFEARAGRFMAPVDITSTPDGTIFVSDAQTRGMGYGGRDIDTGPALHILAPDGSPRALVAIGPPAFSRYDAVRLDAAADGRVYALGRSDRGSGSVVAHLDGRGALIDHFDVPGPRSPNDIAVGPDGRIFLTTGTGIDVYTPDGRLDTQIGLDVLAQSYPGIVFYTSKLDVAPDGRVIFGAGGSRPCTSAPYTPPPPMPTRTPRPSAAGSVDLADTSGGPRPEAAAPDKVVQSALGAADRPAQEVPCTLSVIVVLDSSFGLERVFPRSRYASDIAAGARGVFLAEYTQLYRVGGTVDALSSAFRLPRRLDGSPTSFKSSGVQGLDAAADGRLHLVTGSVDAFYTGAFTLGDPAAPAWAALGISDTPVQRGPSYPLRVAAAEELLVLNAPHQIREGPGGVTALRTAIDDENNISAIQRWSAGGRLLDQRVHDAEATSHFGNAIIGDVPGSQIVDLAYDGRDSYAVSEDTVWSRPDPLAPTWYRRFAYGTRFIAAAADTGQMAALDVKGRRVVFLDGAGTLVREWPLGAGGASGSPSDLALAPGRVYLADQGKNRIAVRTPDGAELGDWPTHDGPRRIAVGPEGDVYVLGRGGFGLRYTPEGRLVTAWRLPRAHRGVGVEGHDIAVGRDGRVYIAFVGLADPDYEDRLGWRIDAGGVWVFQPGSIEVPPGSSPPGVGGCAATVDKTAVPRTVEYGDAVTVTLAVGGTCPGQFLRHDLLIVADSSWSMTYGQFGERNGRMAWSRAKDMLDAVLGALDTERVKVGLVSFGDGAGLQVPLPGDIGDMRARLSALQPDGNTLMGAGIDLAQRELEGVRGDPLAKRSILVVSDGIFKDDPRPAIQAARAAGIEVAALVLTTGEFTPQARRALLALFDDPAKVFVDPEPALATQIVRAVSSYVPNPDLFESLVVRDVVPANMRYVLDSARPPAAWDAATRTLTWTLADVGPAGATLTYQLVPEERGTWPTNVEATAKYRDALGKEGALTFPIPEVTVVTRVFLPWAGNRWCRVAREPSDIVLLLDVSSTMGASASGGPTTRLAVARAAAKSFLIFLDWRRDRVAIVTFDANAHRLSGFLNDRTTAATTLDRLAVGLGTRIDLGLAEAGALISAEGRPGVHPTVILLTDGIQNGSDAPVRLEAERLKARGVSIFTIGLDPDAAPDLLRDIATSREHAYLSPSTDDLARIYVAIAEGLACRGAP